MRTRLLVLLSALPLAACATEGVRLPTSDARPAPAPTNGAPPVEPRTADLESGLEDCRALRRSGRLGAAADGYRALIRAWPADVRPRADFARLLAEQGDLVGAADVLRPVEDELAHVPGGALLRGAVELHGGDRDLGVSLLREELADGEGFREAALWLADDYASRDLHGEAMAILDAALARAPSDFALRLCAARLRFETARFAECREATDALLREWPEDPRALLLSADIAQATGDVRTAEAALTALLAQPPSFGAPVGPSTEALAERRDMLASVPTGGRPPLDADALLALVRGAEETADRLAALRGLAADPRTHARGIELALRQEVPLLRVTAIRIYEPGTPTDLLAVLTAVRDDPSPQVRGAVYSRAADDLDAMTAIRLLSAAIRAEEDPYAFRRAHEGLRRTMGPVVKPAEPRAEDPAERDRIRNEWRQLCPE